VFDLIDIYSNGTKLALSPGVRPALLRVTRCLPQKQATFAL
jgi:hypothetical protein